MKIIQSSIAIAALILNGLVSCGSKSDEAQQNKTEVTQQDQKKAVTMLPGLKMTDVNGNQIDLASLKGKKVFVNLWATWCPPCKAEIPSIQALNSKMDTGKIAFVMLSLDDNFELAKNYAKKNQLKLPVYYAAEDLPAIFKTDGIPATFIFNENGKLIKQNNGADDYDTDEYVQLLKL